jgi:ribosomal protein S18 acetylase RimI-like enzyme
MSPLPSTFRLRDYQPQDFQKLVEIDHACFDPAVAYSPREMRAYLNGNGADCVVAESADGSLAGFCITARSGRRGYIVTLDVLGAFRRYGVGSALLTEAERRMAARAVREVALDTATDNVSAIAFWEKHGYRKQGIRKGYYPHGQDAFAMAKHLVP